MGDQEATDAFVESPWCQAVLARMEAPGRYEAFESQARHVGNCAHPIRLKGHVLATDTTSGQRAVAFSSADTPDGVVYKACENRRSSRCPTCAEVHRQDAKHLVRAGLGAGLAGGKGVPDTVSSPPAIFATLTAPSFGAVHSAFHDRPRPCTPANPKARCPHGRPVACFDRHRSDDSLVGQPLCTHCYRYSHHILWNSLSSELWRRTTIYLRRTLAAAVNMTPTQLETVVRVSFCKVAEFQRRGAVHLHVVVRLDAAGDEIAAPPDFFDANLLAGAFLRAVRAVQVAYPVPLEGRAQVARFGSECDFTVLDTGTGPAKVARYVSKYVAKSSDTGGVLDRPLRPADIVNLHKLPLSDHERRLVETAWRLGGRSELASLKLRTWTHQLGYRGHVLTKSRRYSTTFKALGAVRVAWRVARAQHRGDPWARRRAIGSVEFEACFEPVGVGWSMRGDPVLAAELHERDSDGRKAYWDSHDEDEWYERMAGAA
jgi:hypothetical protein